MDSHKQDQAARRIGGSLGATPASEAPIANVRMHERQDATAPRVSIVCPCFNAERHVLAAVNSVVCQTFTDWEMVIVDDGSTDRSAELASRHAATESRVRILRQGNHGVARARNVGIANASPKSDYVLFLDADDRLHPRMLDRTVAYLEAHPEAACVYCRWRYIDDEGRAVALKDPRLLPRVRARRWGVEEIPDSEPVTPFAAIFCAAGLVPSLMLMRRSAYDRTDGWDEEFGQPAEDTHLFLQLSLVAPIHFLSEPLVDYRVHSTQSIADAGRLFRQWDRLLKRWSTYERLSRDQRDVVRQAWCFRERQFAAANGLRRVQLEWSAGRRIAALRFAVGSAKIIVRSVLLGPPPRRVSRLAAGPRKGPAWEWRAFSGTKKS